jgi:asparagine synthase (glutamine-hydrolysing)
VILGIFDRDLQGGKLKQDLLRITTHMGHGSRSRQVAVWANAHLAFCSIPPRIDTLDETPQPFANEDRTIVVMFAGKIYNTAEIKSWLGIGHRLQTDCSGEAVVHLYAKYQEGFLDRVNGKFAFALWDAANQKLVLGRDRFGIEPLFYYDDGRRLIFGSSLQALLATGWIDKQLNHEAVLQYLLYCYNPGDETFVRQVYKLPAGYLLTVDGCGASMKQYWCLSFAESQVRTEAQYREEILDLIQDAIRIRLDPHRPPGIFLSGGMDSSTIVSLASNMWDEPLRTFSFRCAEPSYDESHYARFIAQHYGTKHVELPYQPDHLTLISRAVTAMDEPFCDIGIEIGTYLLGQAAQGSVSYVFSGEGGDELFGGHPVYIADKLATVVDRLPRVLLHPLARTLQAIPDSDHKKNLQVKLKRFAYSLSFPPELLSHRWRTYYTPQELRELCSGDFLALCDMQQLFSGMGKYTRQADGKDQLSRSLYSDYYTLVGFYLRRLGLLRAFAIESRLPLLDYRLVEYAAKIPSWLKIRRFSHTKYLYKKVLETVLPRKILYERPKLGHSVPMKNWLRDHAENRAWMATVLSDPSFRDRGVFHSTFVQRMIEEHRRKTHNHSHRLWALVVLDFWLRTCWDVGGTGEKAT